MLRFGSPSCSWVIGRNKFRSEKAKQAHLALQMAADLTAAWRCRWLLVACVKGGKHVSRVARRLALALPDRRCRSLALQLALQLAAPLAALRLAARWEKLAASGTAACIAYTAHHQAGT